MVAEVCSTPTWPAGRRAQQRQRLVQPGSDGPCSTPSQAGGGDPVRARDASENASPSSSSAWARSAGRVPGPAAGRQAPGPGGGVRRGQRAVVGELDGLPRTGGRSRTPTRRPPARPRRPPRARPRARARRRPGRRRSGRGRCGRRPGPATRPGRGAAAASRRAVPRRPAWSNRSAALGRRVAQRAGGQHQVTAQPGVLRDGQRVGVRPGRPSTRPACRCSRAARPAVALAARASLTSSWRNVKVPSSLGQQLPGGGLLGVVQQLDGGAAEHGGEQFERPVRADHRRGAQQQPGRAQLVAPRGHRLHQRRGQLRARRLLGQLGEEQRMSLRPLRTAHRPWPGPTSSAAASRSSASRWTNAVAGSGSPSPGRMAGTTASGTVPTPGEAQPVRPARAPARCASSTTTTSGARCRQAAERPGPGPRTAPRGRAGCRSAPAAGRGLRAPGASNGASSAASAPSRSAACSGPELAAAARRARGSTASSGMRPVERPARRHQHACPRPPRAGRPRRAAAWSSRCPPRRRPRRPRPSRRGPAPRPPRG